MENGAIPRDLIGRGWREGDDVAGADLLGRNGYGQHHGSHWGMRGHRPSQDAVGSPPCTDGNIEGCTGDKYDCRPDSCREAPDRWCLHGVVRSWAERAGVLRRRTATVPLPKVILTLMNFSAAGAVDPAHTKLPEVAVPEAVTRVLLVPLQVVVDVQATLHSSMVNTTDAAERVHVMDVLVGMLEVFTTLTSPRTVPELLVTWYVSPDAVPLPPTTASLTPSSAAATPLELESLGAQALLAGMTVASVHVDMATAAARRTRRLAATGRPRRAGGAGRGARLTPRSGPVHRQEWWRPVPRWTRSCPSG